MPTSIAQIYMAFWGAAVIAAGVLMARDRGAYACLSAAYVRSLLAPWKLVTFVVAASFFIASAPYTGDPTWDHVNGAFMSIFTYATAPWAVGAIFRTLRRRLPRRQLFVALVVALFSASWAYDGYLFFRDGWYPRTWWSNMLASSTIYTFAGMMWSVTHVPGRGVVFDFMTEAWFATPPARFRRFALFALLLAAGVSLAMLPFAIEIVGAARPVTARPVATAPRDASATAATPMRSFEHEGFTLSGAEYWPYVGSAPPRYPEDVLWGFYPVKGVTAPGESDPNLESASPAAVACAERAFADLRRFLSAHSKKLRETVDAGSGDGLTPLFYLWVNDYTRAA